MQKVETYKNEGAMKRGIEQMSKKGWRVVSSTTGSYRKAGAAAWVTLGAFNLLRKSKARDITVIFEKN